MKKIREGANPGNAGRNHPANPVQRFSRYGLHALVLSSAIGFCLNANAQAITGGLHGTAPTTAGISVVVTNPGTGYTKTLGVDKNGRYSVDLLAPGNYEVRVEQNGTVLGDYTVTVAPNVSAVVPSASAAAATQTLSTITVSGQSLASTVTPIDVTTPTLTYNYSSQLLGQLPVSQTSIYDIPLLTTFSRPTSIQGMGLPQVAGAGPTENRYYYNGFDTTYDVTGVGAIAFPMDAVTNAQFIPSNAPLEYTSTTGAITAATLRQGSNTFQGGYTLQFNFPTSSLLNPKGKDSYYNNLGGTPTHYIYNSANYSGGDALNYLWASGPIIKDKLFIAATLGYESPSDSTTYSGAQQTVNSAREKSAFVNLTWDITRNQALDVAYYRVRDNTSTNTYNLAQNYVPSSVFGPSAWAGAIGRQKLAVANYHWNINDNMTLRLMAGYMKYSDTLSNSDTDQAYAFDYNSYTGVNSQVSGASGTYGGYAPLNYFFAKRGYKAIFDWKLGDHTITLGAEKYVNTYHYVPQTVQNGYYQYYDNSYYCTYYPGYPGYCSGLIAGTTNSYIPASGLYGYQFYYAGGGTFISNNDGYYAYDNWQVTPNLVLNFGARLDRMGNDAANGVDYLHMNTVSPRLGLAWDVHGDSSLKLGANAGRYTLPLPSALSYTAASAQTYYLTYFSYTGINANGTPQGSQQLGSQVTYYNGSVPALSAIASQRIKNTYQNEFQVYAQQQLTPEWSLLGQADVHILKSFVDQTCNANGVITDYVQTHGYPNYGGLVANGGCIEFNPGKSIVLRDDLNGNGTLADITIPNSYLGIPAASRKYYGLTFTAEHQRTDTQPWYLRLSYTWGHLYGNSDGYANLTKPVGGVVNPADGNTGNFTYREITAGNYGNLAGDVRNKLNAIGVYYFPRGFRLGGVFTAQTGAPSSCLGTYPDASNTVLTALGQTTHYCNGVLTTEGSTWRAPFFWQLDLDFGYDFDMGRAGKVSLDLRMTNVTNRSTILSRNMVYDNSTFNTTTGLPNPDPSYFAIASYQAPRATFLTLKYTF